VAAAKLNTGDRREGDVLDYRANGQVVELHRDDVVLARGLWWRKSARSELPTVRPRAATVALVGGGAPVEIGRQQRVVEHEQATGKLARGWIGAEEGWCWLSTGVPCVAGAEEDGGGGMWLGRSELGTGTERIECRSQGNAVACEREEVKARRWAVHGDEEVAAGGGSGSSWRARKGPPGERTWTGKGRRRRVEKFSAGGGSAAAVKRRPEGQRCRR
jgi:hypothetical protein